MLGGNGISIMLDAKITLRAIILSFVFLADPDFIEAIGRRYNKIEV